MQIKDNANANLISIRAAQCHDAFPLFYGIEFLVSLTLYSLPLDIKI